MFDPISQVKHIADRMISVHTNKLFEHVEDCNTVEGWLEDEESKRLYRQELVFQVICNVFGLGCALQNNPPFSLDEWNNAHALLRIAQKNHLIPEMDYPACLPEYISFSQATIFILNQYAYKDIVMPQANDVVLDCGAYLGETALWSGMCNAGKVYSFEPNPSSFPYLEKNANRYDPEKKWIFPVPLAVSDTEKRVRFESNSERPGSSCTSESGGVEVTATSLDVWCKHNGVIPDFIKMDLEGDEVNAVTGAEDIFRTHKPRFAICLYHQLSHMWEIPFLIKSYCPEYTFWCKKSAPNCEFVLFGMVPHEDSVTL